MGVTLSELAVRFGCELVGNPDQVVSSLGTLEKAGPESVSFLANVAYRKFLPETRAGVVILSKKDLDSCPVSALVCKNPYTVYARVAQLLHPVETALPGIHPSAVVESTARVSKSAQISALAFVGEGAEIGDRVVIGPGSIVEAGASVGADTHLVGRVYLGKRVSVGQRCILHPGAVIGGDGFGLAPDPEGWVKVPQLGSVRLGNDVEIGSNTTVDRGALEDTVLEDDVRLDNQIQIGHNAYIGAHTAMAGGALVAGSSHVGKNCLIAGDVGIAGHLKIADGVTITARTLVNHSITQEGGVYSGALPMDEARNWRRNSARFRDLNQLARTVKKLAKESAEPEQES